jgi:hypothetical protein
MSTVSTSKESPGPLLDLEESSRCDAVAGLTAAAIVADYLPPFDLTSDLLLVLALCPTAPLQRAFPMVPFLSVQYRTPLVIWFGRVTEAYSRGPTGASRREGDGRTALYYELTVVALLQHRGVFVPGIYATSERTIWIGQLRYGMPKQPAAMRVEVEGSLFRSTVGQGDARSFVRARILGTGEVLGRLLSPLWPRRAWPAYFPSRGTVRALLQATPRAHLARVERGRLCVPAAWLPCAVRLLPLGLYLPGQQMQLP